MVAATIPFVGAPNEQQRALPVVIVDQDGSAQQGAQNYPLFAKSVQQTAGPVRAGDYVWGAYATDGWPADFSLTLQERAPDGVTWVNSKTQAGADVKIAAQNGKVPIGAVRDSYYRAIPSGTMPASLYSQLGGLG